MKEERQTTPIPGKRYWLDLRKDVSGVYSPNNEGQSRFIDIEGRNSIYLRENDGAICFLDFKYITEVQ